MSLLRHTCSYEAASGWDLSVLFGGLCNQIYSHIGMLALTVELGAEAVRVAGRPVVPAVAPTPACCAFLLGCGASFAEDHSPRYSSTRLSVCDFMCRVLACIVGKFRSSSCWTAFGT